MKLHRLIDIETIFANARKLVENVTGRADAPVIADTPPDLAVKKGRLEQTMNGYRVTGVVLSDDMTIGSDSAATPMLIALFPLMAMAAYLFGDLALLLSPIFLIATIALYQCEGEMEVLKTIGFGFLLPVFGSMIMAKNGITGGMNSLGVVLSYGQYAAMTLLAVAVVGGILTRIFMGSEGLRKFGRGMGWLSILTMAVILLPPWAKPFFFFAIASSLPMLFARKNFVTRNEELISQGNRFNHTGNKAATKRAFKARQAMIQRAIADKSPFMRIGKALGILSEKGDNFSPDPGMDFGCTLGSLNQHVFVVGKSGSGKTLRVMRRVIYEWSKARMGGMLGMDGKGAIVRETRHLWDKILEPGVLFHLFHGMTQPDVVKAITTDQRPQKKGDDGQFWFDQGLIAITHLTVLHRAVVDQEECALARRRQSDPSAAPEWLWDYSTLTSAFVSECASGGEKFPDGTAKPTAFWTSIVQFLYAVQPRNDANGDPIPEPGMNPHPDLASKATMLHAAIKFVTDTLPRTDVKTRENLMSTLLGWLAPFMSNKEMLPWAFHCEDSLDVTDILRGAMIGVTPSLRKEGEAGVMLQSFVKQRVSAEMSLRADRGWLPDETAVSWLFDECTQILTPADEEFVKNGRSLGLHAVIATQSVAQLHDKFGEAGASAFLDHFSTPVCFDTNDEITENYMRHRLGRTLVRKNAADTQGIDIRATARNQLESPLFDPEHPAACYFRKRVLQGAGRVVGMAGLMGKQHDRIESNGKLSRDKLGDFAGYQIKPIAAGPMVEDYLVSQQELNDILKEPGVALMEVMRGGVPWHDFVECDDPMGEDDPRIVELGKQRQVERALVESQKAMEMAEAEAAAIAD